VTDGQRTIESAVTEATNLQKVLGRQKSIQVKSDEEKQIIKATAHSWFNNHRPTIVALLGDDQIEDIDSLYRGLITAAGRATVRRKYLASLKLVNKRLGTLQAEHVIALAAATAQAVTPDTTPKFDPLISDAKMQAILTRRWQECGACVRSGAPLAATVMMGGLLEGLLLAKINQLSNKAPVFSANATLRPRTRRLAKHSS
jgi:hypothetical protein